MRKVSQILSAQLDQFAFEMPPQVQMGLDVARSLRLPLQIPDLRQIQSEAREKVLASVTELEERASEQIPEEILTAITWLL